MLEPPIDISCGKASSSCESEYYEVGFDAHLNLKSVTLTHVYTIPIQVIHIQTFSPQDLPSNQTCFASEAEHLTLIQPESTSPQ